MSPGLPFRGLRKCQAFVLTPLVSNDRLQTPLVWFRRLFLWGWQTTLPWDDAPVRPGSMDEIRNPIDGETSRPSMAGFSIGAA